MHRASAFILATLSLAFAGPAHAETPLVPHSAEYKVKISVVSGLLTTELRRTATGYVATHTVRPTGFSRVLAHGRISETSEFLETPDGIRPEKYRAVDTISRDEEDVDIRFDWSTGEAVGTVNRQAVSSPMDGVAHDRVSIQYELMHDLLNGGAGDSYVLFEVDRLRQLTVSNIGTQTVEVPAGTFTAVGIRHQAEGSKRRTTLWCVEELGYLPVVIEQHRLDELRVRAVLTKYAPAAD